MAGAGISGRDGDFKVGSTQLSEAKKWSFNPKCGTPQYASNKTQGYKRTRPAVKSGTGTVDWVWDPNNPLTGQIDVGTEGTLNLYIDPTAFYAVPAVLGGLKLDVDMDDGAIVGGSSEFVANGMWTNPGSGISLPPGIIPDPSMPDGLPAGVTPVPQRLVAAIQAGKIPQEVVLKIFDGVCEILERYDWSQQGLAQASKMAEKALQAA